MKNIYYIEAIREALKEELSRDKNVFLIGEDIGVYGGAFGVTKGLICKCPSFRENLKTVADREFCSRGWERYLMIKLSPEKLRLCDGCAVPDENRKVSYLNCRIRKCAILNRVKNCAFCSEYPCPEVSGLHIVLEKDFRKKTEKRLGQAIPEKDYLAFIEPYEGIKHLDQIRQDLKSEDIVQMTPVKPKGKIIPFPEDLVLNQDEKTIFRQLYDMLSTLEVEYNISFARQVFLDKSRKNLLKLIWAFGRYGEPTEGNDGLKLDSELYSAQKITSYLTRVQEFFRILETYGLSGAVIAVDDKTWRTASGALRKQGWFMKLSVKGKKSKIFFKALKYYTEQLENKYGKNAFGYFSRADMGILRESERFGDF